MLAEENILAYLRDTDEEQIVVVGNRGPAEYSAGLKLIALGGIADDTQLRELFTGKISTVINGNLPLLALSAGVQIWRTVS